MREYNGMRGSSAASTGSSVTENGAGRGMSRPLRVCVRMSVAAPRKTRAVLKPARVRSRAR